VKRILVAGIGSVLLGDDGIGPYVARSLQSNYMFDEGIEIEDLGTPALDLIDHIAGLDALIVVDAVNNGAAPGTITLYRKPDLTRHAPAVRLDPHSPALADALWAAEFYGSCPEEVLLVGVSGGSYDATCELSEKVRGSVERAIHEVLRELDRLDAGFVRRFEEAEPDIWWEESRRALAV
jgi:hydrogenase maturation protease